MQIIIPMSGLGKRFVEAGYTDLKPFIPVDGKPMVQHVVELFRETNTLFICDQIHSDKLNTICPTSKVFHSVHRGLGPVDAVMCAESVISDEEEVIVSYCDYGTQWDYKTFLADVREHLAEGAIACYKGFHPHHLGPDCYAYVRENDKWVNEVREKTPFTTDKMNEYASNGTYYFRTGRIMKEYFKSLMETGESLNGEYYVSMAYNHMIAKGMRVRVFEIEKMLQWGTPYDLEVYKMWSAYFHEKPRRRLRMPGITLLPMAGQGNRFRMQGYDTPKPFLPIRGQMMAVAALRDLPETDSTTVISLKSHAVGQYFPGCKIVELAETTNGQATTCMAALDDVDDNTPLTVTACDNGAMYDPDRLENLMNDGSVDVIVWCFTNNPTGKLYPHMYAWLDVDDSDSIREVSIKKPFATKPNTHAIIGTMFFRKAGVFKAAYKHIVDHDLRTNGEFYVDNLLQPLIEQGYSVKAFPVDYYLCWGTPNDYRTFLYWDDYHSSSH
jgi:NDP-sugar pyrophosphorylase family protein